MEDRVKSAFSFRIKELQKHHAALHNRYNSRGKEAFAQQRYGEYYAERIRTEISNRFTRHTAKQSTSHKQSDRNRISDYTGLRSRTRVSVVRRHRSDQLSGTKRYYNRLPRSADRYQRQYGKALASGSAEKPIRVLRFHGDAVCPVYEVRVTLTGYYPIRIKAVPIFSTITSIQPINMIPLSDGSLYNIPSNGEIVLVNPSDSYLEGGLENA